MTAMDCLFYPGPNGREAEARHYTDAVIRMVRGGTFAPPIADFSLRDAVVDALPPGAAHVYRDGPRRCTVYADSDVAPALNAAGLWAVHHLGAVLVRRRPVPRLVG